MKSVFSVIEGPILSEKATALKDESNQILFKVNPAATKKEVKAAVEKIFDVKVLNVNTSVYRGKTKRIGKFSGIQRTWKRAMVKVEEGTDFDVFGVSSLEAES